MKDNKCYAVVEIQKWKSNSAIANMNNHNFRVNPVSVLRPQDADKNEVVFEAPDADTKDRWIQLADILEKTMEEHGYTEECIKRKKVEPKTITHDKELREDFIAKAQAAGFEVPPDKAKEMIALEAEGIKLKKYYDNQLLKGSRTNFVQQFKDRLAQHGIKSVKSNAVRELGIVMKVTKGFENLPEGFDLEKWKADSMQWLKDTFGEENILSAVYHADEFTPHIQASIIPITPDGRLCASEILPFNSSEFSKYQETYFQAVKQPEIYRGRPGGQPGFEDQRKAHNALVHAGKVEVPEPIAGESIQDYQKRVTEAFELLGMTAHLKLKERERELLLEMDELETSTARLEDENIKLDAENKKLRVEKRMSASETKFYREQLNGNGITDRELKDAGAVAARLEEKYQGAIKAAELKAAKMYERVTALQRSNFEMAEKMKAYDKLLSDSGLSKVAVNNNMVLEYISYALSNGYPRAEETKREMQAAYNFGKNAQQRNQVIDHSDDSI